MRFFRRRYFKSREYDDIILAHYLANGIHAIYTSMISETNDSYAFFLTDTKQFLVILFFSHSMICTSVSNITGRIHL